MKNDDFENSMSGLLKTYLEDACSFPDVQKSKAALLKSYSQPDLGLGQLALCFLILVLMASLVMGIRLEWDLYPSTKPVLPSKKIVVAPNPVKPEPVFKEPKVSVKRLSSRVGSTMVYQKKMSGLPVTIIWVFPKGV